MKSILSYITVSIATICVLNSCQKYDYKPSAKAEINGVEITAAGKTGVLAHVDTTTHNPQLMRLTITSNRYTPGTPYLPVIAVVVPHAIGTYTISTTDTTRSGMVYTQGTGSAGSPVVSGEFKILNIKDGRVQGNFTLTCADGTSVTKGQYVTEESWF